jgi:uncharacterized membrane protein YphA (DoxX/SURF4 family)
MPSVPASAASSRQTQHRTRHRTRHRLLWAAQILIALLFLFAGSMKFVLPADKMQQGSIILPMAFIHFIGVCECLGALGLLLPGLLRIRTSLTPLAAAGLTIIMIGATIVTAIGMSVPGAILPAVVGTITAWIAYNRGRVVPLADAPRRASRVAQS